MDSSLEGLGHGHRSSIRLLNQSKWCESCESNTVRCTRHKLHELEGPLEEVRRGCHNFDEVFREYLGDRDVAVPLRHQRLCPHSLKALMLAKVMLMRSLIMALSR